jgi:hypothetical protein
VASACTGDVAGDETGDESAFGFGNPDLKIAIVGAGASGLTAAHTLQGRGYHNITIFEKEAAVGGKVSSFNLLGVNGELGAVFASPDYELVLDLANEYMVPIEEYSTNKLIQDENGVKRDFTGFLLSKYTPQQIGTAIAAYAVVLQKFANIEGDGFAGLHPDLYMTFDKFAVKYGIQPIADLAKAIMIGFGYGYYETVPAAYFMKLLPWLIKIGPTGLESPPYFTFPEGFQSLWQKVAADGLDVQLSSTVTRIERPATAGGKVKVYVNGSWTPQYFDAVIVSAPLNTVSRFMDLNSAEWYLFNKVQTERYFVTLFGALGLATGETVFSFKNAVPSRMNHVAVWGNPGGDLPIFIAYQIADPWTPTSFVTATLALDILTDGGGVFAGPIMRKEWEYFPHVSSQAMTDGFYEAVEGMQGKKGVYFVGSTLSFETVERTARYARHLVESKFPATALAP